MTLSLCAYVCRCTPCHDTRVEVRDTLHDFYSYTTRRKNRGRKRKGKRKRNMSLLTSGHRSWWPRSSPRCGLGGWLELFDCPADTLVRQQGPGTEPLVRCEASYCARSLLIVRFPPCLWNGAPFLPPRPEGPTKPEPWEHAAKCRTIWQRQCLALLTQLFFITLGNLGLSLDGKPRGICLQFRALSWKGGGCLVLCIFLLAHYTQEASLNFPLTSFHSAFFQSNQTNKETVLPFHSVIRRQSLGEPCFLTKTICWADTACHSGIRMQGHGDDAIALSCVMLSSQGPRALGVGSGLFRNSFSSSRCFIFFP